MIRTSGKPYKCLLLQSEIGRLQLLRLCHTHIITKNMALLVKVVLSEYGRTIQQIIFLLFLFT